MAAKEETKIDKFAEALLMDDLPKRKRRGMTTVTLLKHFKAWLATHPAMEDGSMASVAGWEAVDVGHLIDRMKTVALEEQGV